MAFPKDWDKTRGSRFRFTRPDRLNRGIIPRPPLHYNSLCRTTMVYEQQRTKEKGPSNETDERQTSAILNKDNQALKTRKIKLYPSAHQKKVLKGWFGTARWTYNKCLDEIKKDGLLSKKELRATCLNAANFKETKLEWVLNTPYDIRNEGLNDLLKTYKSNFAKGKNQKFTIKKRSKKQASQSIVIHAKNWLHKRGIYWDMFGKGNAIRSAEPLPDDIKYDTRLQLTRLGEYYLCLLLPLEIKSENQGLCCSDEVISLDPGVRTFMTGYMPSWAGC